MSQEDKKISKIRDIAISIELDTRAEIFETTNLEAINNNAKELLELLPEFIVAYNTVRKQRELIKTAKKYLKQAGGSK